MGEFLNEITRLLHEKLHDPFEGCEIKVGDAVYVVRDLKHWFLISTKVSKIDGNYFVCENGEKYTPKELCLYYSKGVAVRVSTTGDKIWRVHQYNGDGNYALHDEQGTYASFRWEMITPVLG